MKTGLDPEALIISPSQGLIPASIFLPPKDGVGGITNNISYDNAALELRPKESSHPEELATNLGDLFQTLHMKLALAMYYKHIPQDASIQLLPAAELGKKFLKFSSVQSFGCSPFCILDSDYTIQKEVPRKPKFAMRSAGFHIHQELPPDLTPELAISILDGLLGLLDVLVNHRVGWTHQSFVRRTALGFGRAGEFRLRRVSDDEGQKTNVLEYRVLSPWPMLNSSTTQWVINTVRSVVTQPLDTLYNIIDDFPQRSRIISAINNNSYQTSVTLRQECLREWSRHVEKIHAIRPIKHSHSLKSPLNMTPSWNRATLRGASTK